MLVDMNKNEAPRGKNEGKGLSKGGWIKVLALGTAIVAVPVYKATEFAIEYSRPPQEQISQQTRPGTILSIEAAGEEGGVAMADVTVSYERVEQTLRMPATEAAGFSKNERVNVNFSVRLGREVDEVEVRIDSIVKVESPS